MNKLYILILIFFVSLFSQAQNVGIGTTTPNANAVLEIKSNNKGLLMPRISYAMKTTMTNVPKGMVVYDTTYSRFYYHDGSRWRLFYDQNNDSATVNYLDNPAETVNIPTYNSNTSTTALSGILYDNGGPSGNYNNNSTDAYVVLSDDSTVGFKIIIEQMNLAANDTLVIIGLDDPSHAIFFGGTTTGTYYIPATTHLGFIFQSNASGNAAGFRIRWSKINVITDPANTPPSFGWYFNPKKLAVRGGISSANNWTADSLGRYSFGWGVRTTAKGLSSISMGEGTLATDKYAIALGQRDTASGINSVSLGLDSKASGNGSVTLGRKCVASGYISIATGNTTTASGETSMTMGSSTSALLNNAVAMGYGTVSGGYQSIATGFITKAMNNNSFSMGDSTLASGENALATGNSTIASAANSITTGSYTHAIGINSTAAGTGTLARSYSSFVIGSYNNVFSGSSLTDWVPTDPLFIIGNGTSSDLNNAMVVLKNGSTGIGTNAPDTKLHIAGGVDAALTAGTGYLVIGDVSGSNLVFDNNEIIARNNGANNTLYLQNNGGAFQVGGTAAKPGGGSWVATSDARLKENVKPYNDGLQQLLKIKPVYYNYNKASGYDPTKQYIGVIAQEIKEVAPYMVGTFNKNGTDYYNVDNSSITYMLINSIKEQQKMIEAQQGIIDDLTKKITVLENKVDKVNTLTK